MISNEIFQAGVVAKLQANTALVDWLTARSAGGEIRESSWQGADFSYPAVRVEPGTQQPGDNGSCYLTSGEQAFSVYSFSESDNSKRANKLAGLVNDALMGLQITGTGFRTLSVQSDGLVPAVRTAERVWRATGLYRVYIYET